MWTRRVPHPVLIGHAASLSQVGAAVGAVSEEEDAGAWGDARALLEMPPGEEAGAATRYAPPSRAFLRGWCLLHRGEWRAAESALGAALAGPHCDLIELGRDLRDLGLLPGGGGGGGGGARGDAAEALHLQLAQLCAAAGPEAAGPAAPPPPFPVLTGQVSSLPSY
jgi:hypothetical protein